MKHKKSLIAILLCVVLIFGLFALVACGETDDDNAPSGTGNGSETVEGILADYDEDLLSDFEDSIYKLFAYGQKNYPFFTLSANLYSKDYLEDEDDDEDDFGYDFTGWLGEIELRAGFGDAAEPLGTFHQCTVLFYENEEDATGYVGLEYAFDSFIDKQYGNKLVHCGYLDTEEFEEILASPTASIVLPDKEQEYIDELINETLHGNKTYHFLSFDSAILNEYDYNGEKLTGDLFQFITNTSICNIYEMYTSIPKSFENVGDGITFAFALNVKRDFLDVEETQYYLENGYYTDNSYLKLEDDTYYAYTKDKAGFVFTENEDDGYTLEYYNYEDKITNLTIPEKYNGKPVTVIGFGALEDFKYLTSITIPNGITEIEGCAFADCIALVSITYQGTKAEWNAISKGNLWAYNTGDFIVHCTDGDIE